MDACWITWRQATQQGPWEMKSSASVDLSRIMQSENLGRSCLHFSIHADFVFCGFYFGSYLWEWAPSFFQCFDLGKVIHYLQFSVTSHAFPNKLPDTASGPPLNSPIPFAGCDHWEVSGIRKSYHSCGNDGYCYTVCLDSDAEGFVCTAHLIPVTALFGQ